MPYLKHPIAQALMSFYPLESFMHVTHQNTMAYLCELKDVGHLISFEIVTEIHSCILFALLGIVYQQKMIGYIIANFNKLRKIYKRVIGIFQHQ